MGIDGDLFFTHKSTNITGINGLGEGIINPQ